MTQFGKFREKFKTILSLNSNELIQMHVHLVGCPLFKIPAFHYPNTDNNHKHTVHLFPNPVNLQQFFNGYWVIVKRGGGGTGSWWWGRGETSPLPLDCTGMAWCRTRETQPPPPPPLSFSPTRNTYTRTRAALLLPNTHTARKAPSDEIQYKLN